MDYHGASPHGYEISPGTLYPLWSEWNGTAGSNAERAAAAARERGRIAALRLRGGRCWRWCGDNWKSYIRRLFPPKP